MKIGETTASNQFLGSSPVCSDIWKILVMGFASTSANSLRGRGWIPSIPGDLSVRRLFSAFKTSSSVTVNSSRGGVVRRLDGISGMLDVSSSVNTE